jgi:hypothetical protein
VPRARPSRHALKDGELRLLGTQSAFVRAIAPTRCHPIVSRRPPGKVLATLSLAVLDRARDRIDMRRYRGGGTNAVVERLSTGLTRAAHAVERLPGMKSGEDEATRLGNGAPPKWKSASVVAAAIAGTLLLRRRHRQGCSGRLAGRKVAPQQPGRQGK